MFIHGRAASLEKKGLLGFSQESQASSGLAGGNTLRTRQALDCQSRISVVAVALLSHQEGRVIRAEKTRRTCSRAEQSLRQNAHIVGKVARRSVALFRDERSEHRKLNRALRQITRAQVVASPRVITLARRH